MTAPPPPPPYGQPYGQAGAGPAPSNNLVWAILTTVFCCLPLGIVAIVKASQVNGLWAQGQYDAANKAAEEAKKWSIWAAVLGVAAAILYVIFWVAVIGNSSNY